MNIHQADQRILRAKLRSATVKIITNSGLTSFGLRPRGKYILTPSHIWSEVGEAATVFVPDKTGTCKIARAQCLYLERRTDLGIAIILDKQVQDVPDITKHFHKQADSPMVCYGMLMRMNSARASSDPDWAKLEVEYYIGPIERRVTRASNDGDVSKHLYSLEHFQGDAIPSVPGDCGQPYLCVQREFGHAVILGLHVGANNRISAVYSSALDQETIIHLLNELDTKKTPIKTPITTTADLFEHAAGVDFLVGDKPEIDTAILTVNHPDYDDSVVVLMDEPYKEWYEALDTTGDDSEELWYDAETNPDSKLCYVGFDTQFRPSHLGQPSHTRMPWSENITFPNMVDNSIVSLSQLTTEQQGLLPKLRGRPSILAQQISYYNDPCAWSSGTSRLMDVARTFLLPKYMQWYGGTHRVLTETETINGLYFLPREAWYQGLEQLNFEASAGDFAQRFLGITSNKALFEPMPTEMNFKVYSWKTDENTTIVRRRAQVILDAALRGIRIITPAKDNLKRELTKPGKARCFQSMAIEETLMVRKYFGTFMAAVMKNYSKGYCQVGTDPYVDMHGLVKRFKRVSTYGEAGDFSRWDKHLMPQLIRQVIQDMVSVITNGMSDFDKSRVENVSRVVIHSIIHTMCIADGNVYIKMKGNPSGNVLTSVLNSMVNDYMNVMFMYWQVSTAVLNRRVFSKIVPPEVWTKPIEEVIEILLSESDWADYGDDFVMVVNKRWGELINFSRKQHFFQKVLGITYDTPEKDGKTYMLKPIEELGFLSRTFDEVRGITTPRLKMASITALFHWSTKRTPDHIRQIMYDAFQELALYPEDTYLEGVRNFQQISFWFTKQSMRLDFHPLPYKDARKRALDMINSGRQFSDKLEIANDLCNTDKKAKSLSELEELLSRNTSIKASEIDYHNDMEPTRVCTLLDQCFSAIDYQNLKLHQIQQYKPMPAYIQTNNSGDYYSVVFDKKDQTAPDWRNLQSDVNIILNNATFTQLRVSYRLVTLVTRRLPGGWDTAVQLHLNVTPVSQQTVTTILNRSMSKFSLWGGAKHATGTAQTTDISNSGLSSRSTGIELPVETNHVNPTALNASLWRFDIKELAHTPMETVNSPISIPVNTPAGTIIDVVSLGELGVMSPAMRLWAGMNSETNATMNIKYEFITAATIVNSLRVGIARDKKSSYSPQELQLIQWFDLNPQELQFTIKLRLAAVSDDQRLPNRYSFSETIASGTQIPTIVLMTRTLIQNSYQNDAVNVNIKRYMWFENETKGPSAFRATAEDLNAGLPAETALGSVRTRGGQTISSLLNLEQGRPFHMVLDGGYTGRKLGYLWRDTLDYDYHRENTTVNIWRTTNDDNTYKKRLRAVGNYSLIYSSIDYGPPTITDVTIEQDESFGTANEWESGTGYADSRIRRLVAFSEDQNGLFIPRWSQSSKVYSNTSGTGVYNGGHILAMLCNDYPGSSFDVDQVPVALAQSELTDPRHFFVISSLNDQNLPSAGLTINANFSASDDTSNDWEVIWSQYKAYLEKTGWDAVVASIETTGLEVYSRYSNARVTTSNTEKWSSRIDTVENRDSQHANDHLWTLGPHSKIIKMFHPIHGNRVAIVLMRNSLTDTEVSQNENRYINFTTRVNASWTGRPADAMISGMFQANYALDAYLLNPPSLQQIITRVEDVMFSGEQTLHPDLSRIVFSPILPSTLTQTIATSNAGVEVNDPVFLSSWINWLANQGVAEDAVVRFQLSNRANVSTFATVGYDVAARSFFVLNEPAITADRYRVYPKLTFEDVVMYNFSVLPTSTSIALTTNTAQWVDRVVADTSSYNYNGQRMTTIKTSASKLITATATKHAELAMLAAGAGGGALSSIAQILAMMNQYKQMNAMQKQQFEHDLDMLHQRFQGQQQLMDKQSQINSLQSPIAQNTDSQSNLADEMNIQSPAARSFLAQYQNQPFVSGGTTASSTSEAPSADIAPGASVDNEQSTPSNQSTDAASIEQLLASEGTSNMEKSGIPSTVNHMPEYFGGYNHWDVEDLPSNIFQRSPLMEVSSRPSVVSSEEM